ncbi:MAG: holo-ACP synthase [Candidatus Limnocylindrales bacterium]
MIRIGVDLVDVDRLGRMVELSGETFLEIGWTPSERRYCAGRIERLATHWAAKEAAMKALGAGIGEIGPLEIEVVSAVGKAPGISLSGSASTIAARVGIERWGVSLSHEGRMAIAFVIGTGASDG